MVHLIEIDTVGLQTAQTPLAGAFDVQCRQPRLVRPIAHPPIQLRRQHNFFPTAAALREPTADDLFGPAFADFPAIDIRRVKKIDAELESPVHDGRAVGFGRLGTEIHRAEAQPAYLHA